MGDKMYPSQNDSVGLHVAKAFTTADLPNGGFLSVEAIVGANISFDSPTYAEVRYRLRHEAHLLPQWLEPGNNEGKFGAFYRPLAPFEAHVKQMVQRAVDGGEVPSPFDKVYIDGLLRQMRADLMPVIKKRIRDGRSKAVHNGTLVRARVLNEILDLIEGYTKTTTE